MRTEMKSTYQRISERLLLVNYRKPKPFCVFENGRLLVGTQSLHQTAAARVWRMFWRIKMVRPKA